ncbi:MAG: response regulator transcription factor [Halobacteriales archaeon]|nr:response regulator transcription factor [Halobacteriales archaeon]
MTNGDSPRVLIVEDDPDVRALYAEYLADEYEVTATGSGEAALDLVGEGFDVVLLDRRLPGLSGRAVLERIRERSAGCAIAVVTAVEPDLDILDMGFDDYVVKPVDRADLTVLVDRLLRCLEYDDAVRRYFVMARKVALLETEGSAAEELDEADARALGRRAAAVRSEAEESLEQAIEAGGFESVVHRAVQAD